MGSILSAEPSPRWGHCSTAVGGQLYVFGGHPKDFCRSKNELASSVHFFNQCVETWQTRATTGRHPPGLYLGACASFDHYLYVYGGSDGVRHDSFHRLDTNLLEWSQLPSGSTQASGPMRKTGCSMITYKSKLILFGGYGISSGLTQQGAEFILDKKSKDGLGWTNELHMFDEQQGNS